MNMHINVSIAGAALLLSASAIVATAESPAVAESRQMLSKHQTVAQFDGIKPHKCLGRTSLCPDQCGHSGDMASFAILKYVAYEKPGEYGDPRQTRYQFLVQDNMKNLKVPVPVKTAVDSLKAGDYVILDWEHDYVTKGGSMFPERVVLKLQAISREEADKLAGGLDKLPKNEPQSERPLPGGYATVPADDKAVAAAAAFAIQAQLSALKEKSQGAQPPVLELVAILQAEQQVVAGVNYRLQMKVKENGTEKTAEAIVWCQAWRKPDPYRLTSWNWK